MKFALILFSMFAVPAVLAAETPVKVTLESLPSPVIFRGDATTAYRDPMMIHEDGWFRLYFTLVKIEPGNNVYSYTAWSKSRDLLNWSEPKTFTPRDKNLNYGSPGNIIRDGSDWVICLQTYPRPNGEKFGNQDARVWTMRSKDLENWGPPELIPVLGPDVPREAMGRMIDPFLLKDKDVPGKWHCFYKRGSDGVHTSTSTDLRTWTPGNQASGGENPCVIVDGKDYVLCFSPGRNLIGLSRSADGKKWRNEGMLDLGQKTWPWAAGRVTAGFLLDLRKEPGVGKLLMVFHGSDFPEGDRRGGFDNFASIGLAWSDDLKAWDWPQKEEAPANSHGPGN